MAKAATSRLARPASTPNGVPKAPESEAKPSTSLMSGDGFDICIEEVGDLPAEMFSLRRRNALELPFKDWFTQAAGAKTWRHIFLSVAFWVPRGVSSDPKKVKNRLYKAHKGWRAEEEAKRGNEVMKLVVRAQGDLDSNGRAFPSDGISIYLRCET